MAINITRSDVNWSYLSLFLVNGINIILLPFILAYLSSSEVGLWYTFTAVYGLVALLDLGFMTTLSRNITFIWAGASEITTYGLKKNNKEIQEPNYELFVKLLKVMKLIYLVIGLIIISILLTFGSFYIYKVSENDLPITTIFISWVLYATAVFLNMRFGYWNAVLKGIGAIKQNQQLLVVTKISQLILTILFLYLGMGLVGVSAAYLISTIINRILASKIFFSYQNNKQRITLLLRRKIDIADYKTIFRKLLPNTFKQSLISISNYINLSSISILSSAFLSLSITASLGLVLQITSITTGVANSFFNTFLPQLSSYRLNNKHELLKTTFKKAISINFFIMFISFTIIIFAGNFMLSFVNSKIELLSWPYLLVIMIYVFLYNSHSVFATYIATRNELPYFRSFIISSLIVLGIQIILMNLFKPTLWSLIIPILLVQLVYNNWKWPYVAIKEFQSLR